MSSIYNTTRITGLFSGMDTDDLVRNLVKNQQSRVDKQYQSLTKLQWKRDSYQGIRDKLSEFEKTYMSVTGSKTMMNSNNYVGNTVDASDLKGYATITAGSAAKEGTYRLTVHQLAKGAHSESENKVSYNGEGLGKASTQLKDLNWAKSLQTDEDGNFSFSINDVEFKFNKADTLQHVISTVDQSKAGVTMTYSEATDGFSIESKEMGGKTLIDVRNGVGNFIGENSATGIREGQRQNGQHASISLNGKRIDKNANVFSIDGVTYNLKAEMNQDSVIQIAKGAEATSADGVSKGGNGLGSASTLFRSLNWNLGDGEAVKVDATGKISFDIAANGKTGSVEIDYQNDTLQDVMNKVKALDIGVTMQYSATDDKITFVTDDIGAGSEIKLTNVNGANLFTDGDSKGIFGIEHNKTFNGQDGIAIIDGKEYTTSDNTLKVNGKEYDLTNFAYETKVFTVERDIDAGVEKIKDFINAFNDIYKELYNMTVEKQERKYPPLTEEQRESLSKEEIEKWEEKAKSGVLRSDSQLMRFLDEIRATFTSKVGSTGSTFASIGITSGAWKPNEPMQLEIDENKLREALNDDPDKVVAMFMNVEEKDAKGNAVANSKGLVTTMRDMVKAFDSELKFDNLQTIDTQLSTMDKRLSDLKTAVDDAAEKWYLKFAQMETALANMQSQQQWIGQQMGMSS